jgi:hypothetical protein
MGGILATKKNTDATCGAGLARSDHFRQVIQIARYEEQPAKRELDAQSVVRYWSVNFDELTLPKSLESGGRLGVAAHQAAGQLNERLRRGEWQIR